MALDRTKAPAIHDAIAFEYNLPPINSVKLDNGLPLHWLNAGVQDVVEIDWVFRAGLWYEQKQSAAQATAGLLKNGTSKHTAEQINEALEFYGAQLKVSAGNDFSIVTLYTLTRHLPALLPMVHEILTDAIFPEHEVELYKRNAIQRLLVNLRQCEFVANQKIDAMLFGEDHPYGRFSKKESIEAVQREDLTAHFKNSYNLFTVQMFMAGKVGEKEVKNMNDVFGTVKLAPFQEKEPAFPITDLPEKTAQIVNDPNGVQGAIRIGRIFPNRFDPDYARLVVLNTLFGGYFGSRLMSNIREDKGYTYGIYSSLTPGAFSGSMVIHTETGRDVIEQAVKEVYKEMDLLRKKEASAEELLLVKNYLLGGLLGDLDGPFSILHRWRTLILHGFGKEQFNNNIRIYKTVTAKELRTFAEKYYDPKAFCEVVVV